MKSAEKDESNIVGDTASNTMDNTMGNTVGNVMSNTVGKVMEISESYEAVQNKIQTGKYLLVYISSPDCSVCVADLARTSEISAAMRFPALHVEASQLPEAAAQLGVFTAPAVLLFYEGREIHRQARFIDFHELRRRMEQILQAEC